MITLKFALYSFVCDVSTFASVFGPAADGSGTQDALSFVCQWSRVHQVHSSGATSVPRGATPPVSFKMHGSDMVLSFGAYDGSLELSTDTDVIAFIIKSSNYGGRAAPVTAKGTLDPQPYIGKPMKKYAIKLRDATGQVIGKLLFALEVHGVEEEQATARAVSQVKRREYKRSPRKLQSQPEVKSEQGADSTRGDIIAPAHTSQNVRGLPKRRSAQRSASSFSQKRSASLTKCGATSEEEKVDTLRAGAMVEHLDIDLEKIVVKNEAIDLDNPPPLLLGGNYNLLVDFGSVRRKTPVSICKSPKEVVCNNRVSFALPGKPGEKLCFSLWENKRQVGGFSIDPAKFCVSLGAVKEYSIPFRYFPTKHGVTLDVTVHRSLRLVSDDAVSTRKSTATHSKLPPSSQQKQNYTEKNSIADSRRHQSSEDVVESNSAARASTFHRRNSAHDYVKKLYEDSGVRRTHWESATGGNTIHGELHQPLNLNNDTAFPQAGFNTSSHQRAQSQNQEHSRYHAQQKGLAANSRGRSSSAHERGVPSTNDRSEWFLDQLADVNQRSSSATRRPTLGVEVPNVVSNHEKLGSPAIGLPERPPSTMRGGTPLRDGFDPNGRLSDHHHDSNRGNSSEGRAMKFANRNHHTLSRESSPWRRHTLQNDAHADPIRMSMRDREQLAETVLSRLSGRNTYRTSLMEEWLDWRGTKSLSATAPGGRAPSRTESVHSVLSRDGSIASIASRNRATSPLPTKSLGVGSRQKPYQPVCSSRSSSIGGRRPPQPFC